LQTTRDTAAKAARTNRSVRRNFLLITGNRDEQLKSTKRMGLHGTGVEFFLTVAARSANPSEIVFCAVVPRPQRSEREFFDTRFSHCRSNSYGSGTRGRVAGLTTAVSSRNLR
jgi:hypothetical protein